MARRLKEAHRQSAVIPYRREQGQLQVLLITSRSGKEWGIPSGVTPRGMPARDAAREGALEQAGVHGHVHTWPAGEYTSRKWGGVCTVSVHLMRVEDAADHWPEGAFRQRRWVSVYESEQYIDEGPLRKMLGDLHTLSGDPSENLGVGVHA